MNAATVYCSVLHCVALRCSCIVLQYCQIFGVVAACVCHTCATHMNESRHTYEWVTWYEWVMSHIWMSHVTQMNKSGLTQNESCHTRGGVTHRIALHLTNHCIRWHCSKQMSHGTHMNLSCHTYDHVPPDVRGSHVTQINESYRTWNWVRLQAWMCMYVRACVCVCACVYACVCVCVCLCVCVFFWEGKSQLQQTGEKKNFSFSRSFYCNKCSKLTRHI